MTELLREITDVAEGFRRSYLIMVLHGLQKHVHGSNELGLM